MIEFRPILQQRLIDILTPAVGVGSDANDYIKTFSKFLYDVPIANLPLLVVTVRTAEKLEAGEIGNSYSMYTWTAHLYYLDMDTNVADPYHAGADKRDHITSRIMKAIEGNRFLPDPITKQPLQSVDADGHTEQAYDSSFQAITFDESGEPGNQSFTTELFLEVYTDRS